MKTLKFTKIFGMISAISFFTMEVLGKILRPNYNPMSQFISELFADGAPFAGLMKVFAYTSFVSFVIFAIGLTVIAFRKYQTALKVGFFMLALAAIVSTIGYGIFPMTAGYPFTIQNIGHLIVTTTIVCITNIAIMIIPYGYLKQEGLISLGHISLLAAVFFTSFNIILLMAMLSGSNNLGYLERLAFYTFYVFIFELSRRYSAYREIAHA